MIMIKLSRRVL